MRNLLALEELSREDLVSLVARAEEFAEARATADLRNLPVYLLFAEPSTRTRGSFIVAARNLHGNPIDVSPQVSSMVKGESIGDTVRTLRAIADGIIVARHPVAGFAHRVAAYGAGVVNAGDGAHEHPTQGLLDLLTLRQEFGRLEGLHVAIVGDVLHSRVARSHLAAHALLGNDVTLVGPSMWIPQELAGPRVRIRHQLDPVIPEVDAVMMLRVQKERMDAADAAGMAGWHKFFALNGPRVEKMRDRAVILHPGPMNVGLEISADAAAHPRARILKQVSNGVPTRSAVLEWAAS